jgi:NAD(P)-dependent dehydrogenase (short-subunit alcohol dehydrogenase family)
MTAQWALVTGAAKRIGRAIALELAQAGWDIVVHFHRSQTEAESLAEEIHALGRKACLAQIDLSKPEPVRKLIPALTAEIGPLAALVNNASLFEPDGTADAEFIAQVNLEAPRLLSEAFHQQVKSDMLGCIVNVLDTDPSLPNFDIYNLSKRHLARLTADMARDYAPTVRVNGVALGAILPSPRQSLQHFNDMIVATPLKSKILPEEVGQAVRFLIDSPSITGDILHVDGGRHLQLKKIV